MTKPTLPSTTATSRRARRAGRLLPLLPLLISLSACSEPQEPTRPVQFGQGMLDMAISQDWELESQSETGRVYVHKVLGGVQLHFDTRLDNFGRPLRVVDVRGLYGRELNGQYGGVIARVSLTGNAMLRYARDETDGHAEPVRCEEWVIAKPVGFDDIARVEISLRVPAERREDPLILALIERLDTRVGDARIPRA